jgi:hypothetical protein
MKECCNNCRPITEKDWEKCQMEESDVQTESSYHRLDAVIPSKKARCPPCFIVANTTFLFAL